MENGTPKWSTFSKLLHPVNKVVEILLIIFFFFNTMFHGVLSKMKTYLGKYLWYPLFFKIAQPTNTKLTFQSKSQMSTIVCSHPSLLTESLTHTHSLSLPLILFPPNSKLLVLRQPSSDPLCPSPPHLDIYV